MSITVATINLYLWVAMSIPSTGMGNSVERDWAYAGEFATVEACHRAATLLNKEKQHACIDSKGERR